MNTQVIPLRSNMNISTMVEHIRRAVSNREGAVMRPIKDINMTFFVRQRLNEARAIEAGEMIENGHVFDPIVITEKSSEAVDGRHRWEGHGLAKRKEIECVLIPDMDRATLIALAMNLNAGGSLPPEKRDTEHTIELFIDLGVSMKQMQDYLPHIPATLLRSYIRSVKQRMASARIKRAAHAVASKDLTVPQAATEFGVDERQLRQAISPIKKVGPKEAGEIKRKLATEFRSNATTVSSWLRKAVDACEDGDISYGQLKEIFDYVEENHGRTARTIANRRKRFEAKLANGK